MTYVCRNEWDEHDDFRVIIASDRAEAAEKFAEKADGDDSEYPQRRTVLVKVPGDDKNVVVFEVHAELKRNYRAKIKE